MAEDLATADGGAGRERRAFSEGVPGPVAML